MLTRQVEIGHGFGSSRLRRRRVRWRMRDGAIITGVSLGMIVAVFVGARLLEWIGNNGWRY